ncbi:hypothetical protein NLJ89_g4530 [Agrocybe chaxingu]|uniref:Uncharacterized protein n=1 Tax=Agrocybe chaxingu TaxID=84603 RepID=A0A9W8MXM8_9AGAR|nr:hypothetical protein NLJ89_g4530 [Agrocybe chaxingu]
MPTFDPQDWYTIATSSGGRDLSFEHRVTGEHSWYTPEGMTAAEIMEIPNASKHFRSVEDAKFYIKKMAAEKAEYEGGK